VVKRVERPCLSLLMYLRNVLINTGHQDFMFDYTAEIAGIGDRSELTVDIVAVRRKLYVR